MSSALALGFVASGATVAAGSMTATITLGGASPRAAASAFVWVRSAAPSSPEAITVAWGASGPTPQVVAVPVGSRVTLTNASRAAHALFNLSPGYRFAHDLVDTGATFEFVLSKPGLVLVHCDDHENEELRLMATDGAPIYRSDANGQVSFAAVANGAQTLSAWHELSEIATKEVMVEAGVASAIALELPASRRRASHPNSAGSKYPPPPGALEITVVRTEAVGKVPATDAVVWLAGSPAPRIPGVRAPVGAASAVEARSKRFAPRVVAVTKGSSVAFPNYDRIYHNVFSLSETKGFDLGLYKSGKSKSVEFDRAGVVKVFCNIHSKMAAYVVVADGAAHAVTGADGRAKIEGVTPGPWKLELWDEKGGSTSREVTIESGKTNRVEVTFAASAFQAPSHKNKFGEDYPPPDDEESRY